MDMQPCGTLRPITVADLDAVLAIEVRAYPWPWSRGNFVDSLAAGHWAQGWWIADGRGDAQLAGYVWALEGVDELHLLNVTVAPEHQRQGLATRLMAALVAEARRLRCERVFLEVRASNVAAQTLYRRCGFSPVGLRRGYYPDRPGRREDAVVMGLDLLPEPAAPGAAMAASAHGPLEVNHAAR